MGLCAHQLGRHDIPFHRSLGKKLAEANQELFIFKKGDDGKWRIARYSLSPTNPPGLVNVCPMLAKYTLVDGGLRFAMALLFVVSATTKVTEATAIQAYMHAYGVPGMLVWRPASNTLPACSATVGRIRATPQTPQLSSAVRILAREYRGREIFSVVDPFPGHLKRNGGSDRQWCGVHKGTRLRRLARTGATQISTGDRTILGAISRRGNRYLRALFVQAAWVVLVRIKDWDRYGLKAWIDAAKKSLYHNVLAMSCS